MPSRREAGLCSVGGSSLVQEGRVPTHPPAGLNDGDYLTCDDAVNSLVLTGVEGGGIEYLMLIVIGGKTLHYGLNQGLGAGWCFAGIWSISFQKKVKSITYFCYDSYGSQRQIDAKAAESMSKWLCLPFVAVLGGTNSH